MGDIVLNNMVFSAGEPVVGDPCLIIQSGNDRYCVPLKHCQKQGFYKCYSVDTSNHKWTGYKAILNNGVYTYSSNLTTGLVYSSVVPVVNGVYSGDALITATLYEG